MSHHDNSIRLRQMLDHSREAVGFVQGKSRRDLDADRLLNLALVQLLTIVGEAAARISEAARKQHPQIPWPAMVGMRNRLIHGYDTINLDILSGGPHFSNVSFRKKGIATLTGTWHPPQFSPVR
jgi:uncharacterized protein with HEPN domain